MSEFQDSSSEFSNDSNQLEKKPITYDISVVKHLPEARKILEGQNYEHQITKCLYQQPLNTNPIITFPKTSNTDQKALQNNRLNKLEEAMFQHVNMKEKIKGLLGQDGKNSNAKEFLGTLWSLYCMKVPSYARFGIKIRKSNFANVLMPMNGVNIILGSRKDHDRIPQSSEHNHEQHGLNEGANSDNDTTQNIRPDTIRFDSHFECGNLLYAYRKNSPLEPIQTYDLILQNDINTKGHNQWFYFKIYNTKTHNRIKFNIINFTKDQSMFSYGIKPLIFSERDYNRHRVGWVRNGEKVDYYQNKIRKQNQKKSYYTLTFEYYFTEADSVYFAPSFPYTHTQLLNYYDRIMTNKSLLTKNIVSLKNICETVGRNLVNILTIGSGKKQLNDCKIVWIIARQHPGQTIGSFMVQGIIEYLISLYTSPPMEMSQLLNRVVFKIIPMLNIDGVIHGNTRAELTGVDPNRMWKKSLKRLSPEISGLKKLIGNHKQNTSLVLDLHSHSKKTGCFFYGNTLLHNPKLTKIYPAMVCESDERFQFKNCRFRGGYESTARSVIFNDLSIPFVYTVQCSQLGFMKNKRLQEFSVIDYCEMGRRLIDCYFKLQKTHTSKNQQQIVSEMCKKLPERDEVDSARSESSLSEDEYEQICYKNRKKVKKSKIIRTCGNKTSMQENVKNMEPPKYYLNKKVNKNHRQDVSTEMRNNTTKHSAAQLPNLAKIKNTHKKHQTFIQNDSKPLVQIITALEQKEQTKNHNAVTKTIDYEKKSARKRTKTGISIKQFLPHQNQVEVQVNIEDNYLRNRYSKQVKRQKGDLLCIVGSSLEDEFVCAFKNEVMIQVQSQIIREATTNANFTGKNMDLNNKIVKKNVKGVPKLLNYICSNLMGAPKQNSIFPQGENKKMLVPIQKRRPFNRI